MPALVETERLRKSFGSNVAVDGITLKVEKGEVLGFLGPNGAGKSTTMKMVTGFLTPDSGTAHIAGIDVLRDPKAAKRRMGYLPEGAPSYGDMTVKAFLSFIADVRGLSLGDRWTRMDTAVDRTGLGTVLDQRIETLSKGFRRRVGLAQAILHDPEVLILDEPTDGLDPNQKHQVRKLIQDMAADKAIIVSTHILEEVEAVCTRAIVIDKGVVVADGTAEDLQKRLPYHNAVSIKVRGDSGDKLIAELNKIKQVARVETLGHTGGLVHLRVYPRDGAQIATDIAGALRERNIVIDELFVERGRLDDVFRQITSSDSKPGSDSKSAGGRHA
jgi:ABC-2 type transport system ATP-binding protein